MKPFVFYFKNPRSIGLALLCRVAKYISNDRLYLKIRYFLELGQRLDLDNPKTFNEKLNWLKLYNRKPEYTMMVDKYAVKEYVANKIGKEYVIPTLGVWNTPEEIDFDALPNQFVLKTTHGGGGGGVVICKDKATFIKDLAIAKLNRAMKADIYILFREWPYKNVEKRIIAEKYEEDSNGELPDYKFYCFNGRMQFMFIASGRFSGNKTFDYYDKNFKKMQFEWGAPASSIILQEPIFIKEMVKIAEEISKEIPHARVDLFYASGHIYFGEITFFDGSGFTPFVPAEWDLKIGRMLGLPAVV